MRVEEHPLHDSSDPVYNLNSTEMFQHVLASASLVDFPQFRDIHHLIPQALIQRRGRMMDYYCDRIEDSDNWDLYVKYRKIVSRFLITNQIRSSDITDYSSTGGSFVHWSGGEEHYVSLAKYLLSLLSSKDLW